MKIGIILCAMAVAVAGSGGAGAQNVPAEPAISLAAPAPPSAPNLSTVRGVAQNTSVIIAIDVPLTSKTSKIGDTFPIRLTVAVTSPSGEVLIPAGARGQGEVIHAAKARALGKPGEMIRAARYLQCGDTRIPLGHFKFGGRGDDHSGAIIAGAVVAGLVAAPLMFMSGGEMIVPAGTSANAKITADVAMTPEATASCGGDVKPKQ